MAADYTCRCLLELTQSLDYITAMAKDAKLLVTQAYSKARLDFMRIDTAAVDDSQVVADADATLEAARDLIDRIHSEVTTLLSDAVLPYATEVKVDFPIGITHFKVDNSGTDGHGRVTVYGRNDAPTSLFAELFADADKVIFLDSSELPAANLNQLFTIATSGVSGNTIEFTAAFSGSLGTGNDTILHMRKRSDHIV